MNVKFQEILLMKNYTKHTPRRLTDGVDAAEPVMHNPRQITSPEQLKVGQTYKECSSTSIVSGIIRVIAEPRDGRVEVRRKVSNTGEWFPAILYLANRGILPYQPSGHWNREDYLVPFDEKT